MYVCPISSVRLPPNVRPFAPLRRTVRPSIHPSYLLIFPTVHSFFSDLPSVCRCAGPILPLPFYVLPYSFSYRFCPSFYLPVHPSHSFTFSSCFYPSVYFIPVDSVRASVRISTRPSLPSSSRSIFPSHVLLLSASFHSTMVQNRN